MKVFFFLLTVVLIFSSCNKKTGEVKMVLEISDIKNNSTMEDCAKKITKRIDDFWRCTSKEIKTSVKNNQVEVSFPVFAGDSLLQENAYKLLNIKNSSMQFWEACGNIESFEKLTMINKIVRDTFGDSLIEQLILKDADKIEKDFFGRDTVVRKKRDSLFKIYPLSIYLTQNVGADGYLREGPIIGFARAKDTASVNAFLNLPQLKKIVMRNIEPCWSARPYEPDAKQPLYELYFLKKIGREPLLTGDQIEKADMELNDSRQACIYMTFNQFATVKWREITQKLSPAAWLQRKAGAIAMVVDNKVYSAPNINGVIPDGKCEISGIGTIKDCMELLAKIKSPFNFSSKIVAVQVIPDK